jgi:hypothetical protein
MKKLSTKFNITKYKQPWSKTDNSFFAVKRITDRDKI